jgi:hypothetical protein
MSWKRRNRNIQKKRIDPNANISAHFEPFMLLKPSQCQSLYFYSPHKFIPHCARIMFLKA